MGGEGYLIEMDRFHAAIGQVYICDQCLSIMNDVVTQQKEAT